MSKNRDELVNDALEILLIKETGQAAEDEDYTIVDNYVDGLIDELSVRELCNEIDVTEIDDVLFRYVSILLANTVSFKFGVPSDQAAVDMAEKRLRQISEANVTDKTVQQDYF